MFKKVKHYNQEKKVLDNSLNIELKVGELCSLTISNVGGQKRAPFTKGYAKVHSTLRGGIVC